MVLTVLRVEKISCARGYPELCVGLTGITAGFYCLTLVLPLPHSAVTDLGLSFCPGLAWLHPLGLSCLRGAPRIECCDLVVGASCTEPLWASPAVLPNPLTLHHGACAACWELLMANTVWESVHTAPHQQNSSHGSSWVCWSSHKRPLLLWFPQTSPRSQSS